MEAKHVNEFRPNDVMWEKTSKKGLLRNPERLLKNTDKRMVYIYNNIFFAKKDFTFGLRTVKSGEIHLIQTTHVPMSIYELPASRLKCRAQPNVIRRSFEPHDQMLYHRRILEPHTAYPIPVGKNYIVLTIQKTAFGLYIISESLLPQLIQKGFHVGDFRKMKKFNQTPYKLPPPTPIHVPAEKQPLEEKSLPFCKKRSKVRITPVMRRVSRRYELPMAPVEISQPPVQIHSRCPRTCADSITTRCPRVTCVDSTTTCADSRCPRATSDDSTCPTITCADSSVPCLRATCADSSVTSPRTTCADSSVTSPTVTCADSMCSRTCADSSILHVSEPVQILHVSEPVQIPDDPEHVQIPVSQVPQLPMKILHVSEPVQIPVSQVPQSPVQSLPEPMQLLPELDILDPLESTDAFDQLMSFVFGPQ
ncbi:uncharacterized protein TNCV_411321 [Trichonephila clavipes]|nr:uncharacterized protein TNCV_411321 [Trichonephila clavipes]